MNESIVDLINIIVQYATSYLMPFLIVAFCLAVAVRLLITVIINRQKRFVKSLMTKLLY